MRPPFVLCQVFYYRIVAQREPLVFLGQPNHSIIAKSNLRSLEHGDQNKEINYKWRRRAASVFGHFDRRVLSIRVEHIVNRK